MTLNDRGRRSAASSTDARLAGYQRLRVLADVLRAVDLTDFFAIFARAGLRFVAVLAMLSPLLPQANHLQQERITADSAKQVPERIDGGKQLDPGHEHHGDPQRTTG
jgi:hypothetical protein